MIATERTQYVKSAPMTWDRILADRIARGLEKPGMDPRLPSNVQAHVEEPYHGPSLSKAKAASERKRRMKACGCRLCALVLNPPMTFAEAERFGLHMGGFAEVDRTVEAMRVSYVPEAA